MLIPDRHEVVDSDALDDEKLARPVILAVHVMRRLRRDGAALAGKQPVHRMRRPRLDHHRPLETDEAVGDRAVIVPGHALPLREGQHHDAQIGAFRHRLAAGDHIIAARALFHEGSPSLPSLTCVAVIASAAKQSRPDARFWIAASLRSSR